MEYKDNKVYMGKEWHCTDIDSFQFARKITPTEFEYCQLKNEELIDRLKPLKVTDDIFQSINNLKTTASDWYCGTIDINDYSREEIIEVLSSYGGILDNITDIELINQIIAECIFETYMLTDFC